MADYKERLRVSKQKMMSLFEKIVVQSSRLRDLTEAVSRKFEEQRKVADARVIYKIRYLGTQLVERQVEIEKAKEKFKQLQGEVLEAKAKVLELESKLVDVGSKLMVKDEDLGEPTLKLIHTERRTRDV